jgi:hypothetical protein
MKSHEFKDDGVAKTREYRGVEFLQKSINGSKLVVEFINDVCR